MKRYVLKIVNCYTFIDYQINKEGEEFIVSVTLASVINIGH
jgi:hypothetical protein